MTGNAVLSADVPLVVLASAVWETPSQVNAHQIARRFAGRGHRVLFVESTGLRVPRPSGADPARVLRRVRDAVRGVREPAPGLHVLSPLALPGAMAPSLQGLSTRALAFQVRRALGALRISRPVIWSFLPTWVSLADRLPARLWIYHCVDHYAANPGVERAAIEAAEARMLERADLVLASSPVLAERLGRNRPDVETLPNVADVELFGRALHEPLPEPAELAACRRPRLVYVGNLAAYRIDFGLLAALARALPGAELVLVGAVGLGDVEAPPAAYAELLGLPNVTALGPRPPAELPALLRHCDVGLIPFLDNEHTRGSLPLKLWEYLAAGLAVVATDLPNLRSAPAEAGVRLALGSEAFAGAIREALAEPPEARTRRGEAARGHGWEARVDALAVRVARSLAQRL